MSLVFTGGVALAYTVGVIGIHRWSVFRRRARAQNYPALDWLDWDTLLADVWKGGAVGSIALQPSEGGPPPRRLSSGAQGRDAAFALVSELVQRGARIDVDAFERAGFSGGEARWLASLSERLEAPDEALAHLTARPPASAAEAAYREWLSLRHEVTPFSVEWQVYASKRRLSQAIRRFGDAPALYFARAHASSLLGFHQSVLDDLGRAVFFSREAPFYVEAVLSMPFVQELRPPLALACRDARERHGPSQDRLDESADSG